jgi:pimeloyl-ACP methyl ester carboxylesterase
MAWLHLERDGVRLACFDFGGEGQPALLLHGLAGHAGEWSETAEWLRDRHRVLALDQRGHGRSERLPLDVSRAAYVDDAVAIIEQLGLGPVVLIGQSLGGHAAFLTAARRPDLVRALIVVEASPNTGGDEPVAEVAGALGAWPVPFPSRQAALEFFGGPSLRAEAWTNGLEERDGGWWPRFDLGVMVRALREGTHRSYWAEWERIRCSTLVVRGERGILGPDDARAMVARLPGARLAEIAGAGHDLHVDQPGRWRAALLRFLAELPD